MPPVHPALGAFTPRFSYFLLQENQVAADYSQQHPDNLVGHLMALGQCTSPQAMRQVIADLHQQVQKLEYKQVRQTFSIWISRMVKVKFKDDSIPEFQTLNEVDTMLSERMDSWQEGWLQKGLQEGEMLILKKQVHLKFGSLPDWVEEKITSASTDQLELWAERILTTNSLDELLS